MIPQRWSPVREIQSDGGHFTVSMVGDQRGEWVRFVDHLAALAEDREKSHARCEYENGFDAALNEVATWLRHATQHPSEEAGAWAYGFAEVIDSWRAER